LEIGEAIAVTSSWKIQENSRSRAHDRLCGGRKFGFKRCGRGRARPRAGSRHHGRNEGPCAGQHMIQASLTNSETATTVTGNRGFHLVEGKDEILRAWASVSLGDQAAGTKFQKGGQVFVNAWVRANAGYDGGRTLSLEFQGKAVMSIPFPMKPEEVAEQGFALNTGKMDAKQYRFKLVLTNDDKGFQDSKIIRLELKDQPQPDPQRNTGGMKDVDCTGDTVTLKVWDHATQDGDIISLKLGR